MRYLTVVALAILFFTATSYAQDQQAPEKAQAQAQAQAEGQPELVKAKKAYREVPVDRNGDGKIDGVDFYDDQGRLVRKGYDENGDGLNDRYLDYDPNTGMPMVTQSDKEFGE